MLQIIIWGLVASWSLLLIAWLTLHWGILTHIEQWRPQIERRVGQAIGAVVQIGRIEVTTGSWVPALELRDVVIVDAQQREALRLPYVAAALSPRSLLALEPRLQQVLIQGADLDVRRDASGRLWIGGLEFGGASDRGEGSDAADWFFSQHEFVVRGGTLRWIDERRQAGALSLRDVSAVVRNGLRRHELRIDATPPDDWGARFTIQGRFTQPLFARAGDWQRWQGELHTEFPRADVRQLRRHADLPFELTEGEGALRGWLQWADGQPRGITLDVALRAVALRLAADVEPMAFDEVQGRIDAKRSAEGLDVSLRQFGFVTREGLQWPRGDARLFLRQPLDDAQRRPITGGEFSAQQLDLGIMAGIAEGLPLGLPVRELLEELAPKGIAQAIEARWDGAPDAIAAYRIKGSFRGVSLAARASERPREPGRPGVRNADFQIDATDHGGSATIAMENGALEFPGVFQDPLVPIQTLSGQLAWSVVPGAAAGERPQVEVQVRHASFANPDAQGQLTGTWRTGDAAASGRRYPGVLKLDGHVSRGKATGVARYMPVALPPSVRNYVRDAVRGGSIGPSSFHVSGDLREFPFHRGGPGEFRVAAKVLDADFAYVPGEPGATGGPTPVSPWPAMSKVNVDLLFDRTSMEISNGRARIDGVELSGVSGRIRTLTQRPELALEGTARGPLGDALDFVARSPLNDWTGGALAAVTASGDAALKLALRLPLGDLERSSVEGSVQFSGNDVRIRPDTPLLVNTRGRLDFTRDGFAVVGATAQVLGGEARFEGGSQRDGSLRFTGQGTTTADGLRGASELGVLAKVAGSLEGQAPYRMTLGFVDGRTEIDVASDLVGMAIELPAPLDKPADTPLAMRYRTQLLPGAAGVARDRLQFELGTLVQAQFERELPARQGEGERVVRGGVGIMEAPPWPARGVHANVTLPRLNADAWQAAVAPWFEDRRRPGGNGVAPREVQGAGAAEGDGTYMPSQIGLRVENLTAWSRNLSHVVAGVSQDAGVWRANVKADELDGYIEFRQPRRATGAGRVYARLARLALPKNDEVEGVETILDQQPASVPALDIEVDDFELRGLRLGRVEIEAVNRGPQGAREWRMTRFNIFLPEATLTAIGNWVPVEGQAARGAVRRRAEMTFQLDVDDGGALLDRLGMGRAVRGGKGKLAGEVAWIGSPLSPDFASLSGKVNVALKSGQFLKAEPGAARLLGVLSLQALPRRLLLDFRDVFEEGFRFDSFTGDLDIAEGVASTENLRMHGVQAIVAMEGQADLQRETQDLRVVVVPQINAGAASLAYAAINPAVGVGTFLAQLFLRKPLMQAGTREFHVSGPWSEPKVERVARKMSDPVPELGPDPADAGASASAPPPAN